jgi:Zn-dependent protease with chaperone function
MNFFEQQEKARRNTKYLVFLFVLALLSIGFAVNSLVALLFVIGQPETSNLQFVEALKNSSAYTWLALLLLVGGASLFRMLTLGGSGRKIAEFLGGTPLPLEPENLKDRQLRNTVEEMSIASGIPVPDIYVLRGESGINAFAAGLTPSEAVIGVTQGTIDKLNRDELQGVIAHEFSHIFNGDMRLNLKLIGVISGILFLSTVGRVLMDSVSRRRTFSSSRSGKNDGRGFILILGLGLFLIGLIGVFFGNLIKAAVSRQREFLADASAVQFTRNPNGIGGALKKIKGSSSAVSDPRAGEASHMFFGSIKNFSLFATHPPIDERLARIKHFSPDSVGQPGADHKEASIRKVGSFGPKDLAMAGTLLGLLNQELSQGLHNPHQARAAFLAALDANETGLDLVKLADLALPALKELNEREARDFLDSVSRLVFRDKKLAPLEIAALAILRRHLGGHPRKDGTTSYRDLIEEILAVLRLLSRLGVSGDPVRAYAAFLAGGRTLGVKDESLESFWKSHTGSADQLDRALWSLSKIRSQDKEKVFQSMWTAAHHDSQVSNEEFQILRAVCESMEIPLPLVDPSGP